MIAQTVAELLADHVRLTVEGIDRMYLNVYVPRLQCAYGAVSFFRDHRGQPLASSALMSPMSRRFVAELDRFIARHQLPVVLFRKGQRNDEKFALRIRGARVPAPLLPIDVPQGPARTPMHPAREIDQPLRPIYECRQNVGR